MRVGCTIGDGINEIVSDLKKDMGLPEDSVIFVVHIPRKDIEKMKAALDLVGLKDNKIAVLRETDRVSPPEAHK